MKIPTPSHEAALLVLCGIYPVKWDKSDGKLMLWFEEDERLERAKNILQSRYSDICIPIKSYTTLRRIFDDLQLYKGNFRSFLNFTEHMFIRMPVIDLNKMVIGLPYRDVDGNLINRPGYNLEEDAE